MYKLEFTLKQHTPLIHFQHDQAGATLRATEVKPKLDRFIIRALHLTEIIKDQHEKIEQPKREFADCFINKGKDHLALDYKIRIDKIGSDERYFITSNPRSKNEIEKEQLVKKELSAIYLNQTQYFGNNENLKNHGIEKREEIKIGIKAKGITISICTFSLGLYKIFCSDNLKMLKAFFVANTFGTRQNKGFGCFLPEGISEEEIVSCLNVDPSIIGVFKKELSGNFIAKIQEIARDYSLLKRGKTFNGYKKSKLWEYLCATQQIKWEKRKIKLHIKSNNPSLFNSLKAENSPHKIDDCGDADGSDSFAYIRALLGLAEHYEFVKVDRSRLKVKIADSSPAEFKIDRFQSPISYLVSDNVIYLIARSIDENLQKYTDNSGKQYLRQFSFEIPGLPSFQLTIPTNFDLVDFLSKKSGYIKLN